MRAALTMFFLAQVQWWHWPSRVGQVRPTGTYLGPNIHHPAFVLDYNAAKPGQKGEHRNMKKAILIITILFSLSVMTVPVYAGHVIPHRHFILKKSGEKVYVGPNMCSVPANAKGLDKYHDKVHLKMLAKVFPEIC